MELNFLRDNRFNNLSHKSFFLDYMFVTNKNQLEKHESHDFFAYINRKVHIYHEETDIDKRKQAVSILKRKEIISVLMPPNINHKPQRFLAIHKITAFFA